MIENIQALAADIDMTLTFKGQPLPPVTKEAFEILHRNGVKLGLATGRCMTERLKKQDETWELPFKFDFIVGGNGGMIYNHEDDSFWSEPLMTVEEMKAIVSDLLPLIMKYGVNLNCEGGENHNAMNISPTLLASALRNHVTFVDKTGDVDGFCDTPAYKFLLRSTPPITQKIKDFFLAKYGDRYQLVETFPGSVEIYHLGIDKGNGLQIYAKKMGIPMADIIAFGDNENDNTLLLDAGWGVCLKDGNPETMKIADAVTDYGCGDGGVGHYLFDYYILPKGLK